MLLRDPFRFGPRWGMGRCRYNFDGRFGRMNLNRREKKLLFYIIAFVIAIIKPMPGRNCLLNQFARFLLAGKNGICNRLSISESYKDNRI